MTLPTTNFSCFFVKYGILKLLPLWENTILRAFGGFPHSSRMEHKRYRAKTKPINIDAVGLTESLNACGETVRPQHLWHVSPKQEGSIPSGEFVCQKSAPLLRERMRIPIL